MSFERRMSGVSELSKKFRWPILNLKFKVDHITPFESYGIKKLKKALFPPVYKCVYRVDTYLFHIIEHFFRWHPCPPFLLQEIGEEISFLSAQHFFSIIWYIFSENMAVYLNDPVKIIIPYCSNNWSFSWYIWNALLLSYHEVTIIAYPLLQKQIILFLIMVYINSGNVKISFLLY